MLACPTTVIPKLLTHDNPLEKVRFHVQAARMPPELAYPTPHPTILVSRYILGSFPAYGACQLVWFGSGLSFDTWSSLTLLLTNSSRWFKAKALKLRIHSPFTDLCWGLTLNLKIFFNSKMAAISVKISCRCWL